MKSLREAKAEIRRTLTNVSWRVFAATSTARQERIDVTDCRVTLTCSCGTSTRVSSPLGAFMSGWRKIQWEDRAAQCWLCEREQRLAGML
jgi:hypothetical protein